MADALISAPVGAAAGAVAVALIAVAAKRTTSSRGDGHSSDVALMGVMGAFVFAAQMINFSIPGTGSSGHIIGGVLLASLLGPWVGFLTLCSVLIVQCLVFADGGLVALGCNIVNMAAMSCLVAWPLVYKPLIHYPASTSRLVWVSVATSVVGLELGALLVSAETVASGVTALPFGEFLAFMLPIHLAIGICEGVASGLVLAFVEHREPSLLSGATTASVPKSGRIRMTALFAAVAVVLAASFTWIASSDPDGLEWSIFKITGATELAPATAPPTAFMPDYVSHLSGIVGGIIVMTMIWAVAVVVFRRHRPVHTR